MASGERQQEQPAGRVVGDHRGIVYVEQVKAVEQQPGQRRSRPVRSLRQRPGMRTQWKVDRDAAMAVLKRGDNVPPQFMIRERAGVEDDCRTLAGRLPGEGSETGVQLSGFHKYKTYY
jgi:hypothetical protein